jgi:uncharacterized protein (PEP-CTERM system associated)
VSDWQHHAYGDGHTLSFEHRMARTVIRISDSENLNVGTSPVGVLSTNYDLFFQLFATVEPDLIKRDALVRSQLAARGLSPDAPFAAGVQSNAPTRLRNQQFSMAYQGLRSTLTAQIGRTVTRRVGTASVGGDLASTGRIEQRSYSLSAGHQLTPSTSVNLVGARQESKGDLASQSTTLNSLTANWNARLGSRLNVSLGLRHSKFAGVTPYSENAVLANLVQQF